MTLKIFILLFLTFVTITNFAQKKDHIYLHPFSNSIGLTLEAGGTYSKTDFNSNRYDYSGRGMIEYFFNSNSIGTFGLRIHGGLLYVGGEKGVAIDDSEYSGLNRLKTTVYHLGGGYSYTVSLENIIHPYIFAGLSYIQYYPRGDNNSRIPSINNNDLTKDDINYIGELGLRFLVHDNFSFNMSGTIHYNPNDNLDGIWGNNDDDIFYSANFGISYYFNDARDSDADGIEDSEDFCPDTPPHFIVDEFGCPTDADKDGVPDQIDLCPGTKTGVLVDLNGCAADFDEDGIADSVDKCLYTPTGILVDNNGCPVDVDRDGVPDSLDQCLYTPLGTGVDSVWCPLDRDKDGVADIFDRCSDTPPNTLVDSLGCPDIIYDTTYNRVVIPNFIFGDNALPKNAEKTLSNLLKYIIDNPVFSWSIEGHADSISENCDDNYIISVKRAETIYNYLIKKGVSRNRLSYIGFSNFRPIAENNSATGRKRNRRVEIIKIR